VERELQAATHAAAGESDNQLADLLTLAGAPDGLTSESERAIVHALSQGPMTVPRLCRMLGNQTTSTERLEALGILRRAGLTPTDILWSESSGVGGSGAAARAGAQVVARQLGVSVQELARQVLEQVVDSVAQEVLDKLVADRTGHSLFPAPRAWAFVLEQSLRPADEQPLRFQMLVRQPIVAIGAPVKSFMPLVADKLHTRCVIPPHAEVGNAVGAVVAGITHVVEVLVQPHVQAGGTVTFLIHSARGRQAADSFGEAVAQAEAIATELAQNAVRESGAELISVKVDRRQVDMGILAEMTVRACATGRPRLAE
jgi:N-methylhydantoinase A/oxoprolinase/acetone carboxylase beta subunit